MIISVTFPSLWRPLLGSREVQLSLEAKDVRGTIQQLLISFPQLQPEVLDDQGNIHHHLLFFLNDENIAQLGGLDTPVRDGDRFAILLAVAGGSASPGRTLAGEPETATASAVPT